ncbi:MAG: DnaJ domain-containing protein, partial [Anaerolineae bacterium]
MAYQKPDYYSLLGVSRNASQEEIKRAYLEAARRLHPDKNVAPGETELFLAVQQAYETLSNPVRRAQYDATLPAEEETNTIIQHKIFFSRPNLVRLNEPQLLYLLLVVAPVEDSEKIPAPPLNICLLLDRSTSMQGEKLDMVKSTAIQLIRSLRPQDILSVVAFSDRAEAIIPAGYQLDRQKQEARILAMQPFGATEIFQGLEAAVQEVRRSLDPGRVNHIILLTDGHTYGDEQACLNLAEEAARQNIGISGLGIGGDWNDIFLDTLASRTGGSSAYISRPQDIQRLLAEKFRALANSFADDVQIDFKPQKDVHLNYIFRLQPEGGPVAIDTPLRLGPILRDTPLNVLFEFVVQPPAVKENLTVILDGNLKVSIATQPLPVPPRRLYLTRPVRDEAGSEPPP